MQKNFEKLFLKNLEWSFKNLEIKNFKEIDFDKVALIGKGGSLHPLLFSKEFFDPKIPIFIIEKIDLPRFLDENTLCILCSYSGNTKENLIILKKTLKRRMNLIAISSNGILLDFFKKRRLSYLEVPKGYMPRFSFPFLISSISKIFEIYRIGKYIKANDFKDLKKGLRNVKEMAKKCYEYVKYYNFFNPIFVSYYWSLAKRWKDVYCENVKLLSYSSTLTEFLHNEIEGWKEFFEAKSDGRFVFIIKNSFEPNFVKEKIERIEKIFKKTEKIRILNFKGKNIVSSSLKCILCGDLFTLSISKYLKKDWRKTDLIKRFK